MAVIATLMGGEREVSYALPEDITIPPFYLIRHNKLWAIQTDWEIPPGDAPFVCRYRRVAISTAIDISDLKPVEQESEAAA